MPIAPVLAAGALLLASLIRPGGVRPGIPFTLSALDRHIGMVDAHLAGHDVEGALRWARTETGVAAADLGTDGRTIVLHYRDGHEAAILPANSVSPRRIFSTGNRRILSHGSHGRRGDLRSPAARDWTQDQQTGETARALVLEPFATELGLGAEAGAEEAADLRHAGFAVDVRYNDQVTVPVMQQIPRYGATYIDTHSGTLDNGDAVVVTGETETGPYAPYFRDHTLIQAFVAGDPAQTLYNAVTGSFFVAHAPSFPAGSLLFLNGCTILGATRFWDDLHGRGLSTLISWDARAQIATNEAAASFVLGKLEQGYSVGPVVSEAQTEGYGLSLVDGVVARLGYLGAGNETLADALHSIDPAGKDKSTAMPAPTATPTPTSTPAAPTSRHRCRPGHHRSHGRCVRTRHHKSKP